MKFFQSFLLGILFIAGSAYADGFGFNLGPFDLQFGVDNNGYPGGGDGNNNGNYVIVERRAILDNPICDAISNQQQLAFTARGKEIVNTKELRIVSKRLTVEPYAFGITREGRPILRGKVIDDKLIKEVTVKFGEEKFNEPKKGGGGIFGSFQSSDKKNIDIQNISDLQVLRNTHFDAPKNYEGIKDDNIRVICQLPVKNEK